MTGDQTASLIFAITMLVFVASGLVARRLPIGQMAKMAAAWVAIFAAGILLFSYRGELLGVWQRVSTELLGGGAQTVGDTLRVTQSPDGHFWVTGRVNGSEHRFLIDSGATTMALSVATADAAGIDVDQAGFPVLISTANGTVEARRARIERFGVGPIVAEDLAAIVSPAFGDMNVIGMNFLSSLASWRVEGRTLVLEPRGASDAGE